MNEEEKKAEERARKTRSLMRRQDDVCRKCFNTGMIHVEKYCPEFKNVYTYVMRCTYCGCADIWELSESFIKYDPTFHKDVKIREVFSG